MVHPNQYPPPPLRLFFLLVPFFFLSGVLHSLSDRMAGLTRVHGRARGCTACCNGRCSGDVGGGGFKERTSMGGGAVCVSDGAITFKAGRRCALGFLGWWWCVVWGVGVGRVGVLYPGRISLDGWWMAFWNQTGICEAILKHVLARSARPFDTGPRSTCVES